MGIARLEHVPLPYLSTPAEWAALDSGHQVIVIRKPGESAHLHTVVRTGSVNETDANTGISHFLEAACSIISHSGHDNTQCILAGEFSH